MLEVLNPLSLSYQWCHLNMKFHFPPILISQVESSYTLLYFTMNKEKKSIGQINTQNVRFMTPFVNFFFFSFKRKENCEKENSICHDLGFYSSESSYTSRIRIPLMEYFLLFSKKHCRAQKDLFFFINYQHLQQRERQLLEGISDNAAAKSLQSCPTLCDLMDCRLPSFSVHGILQARTLEWVAISFSNA